MFLAMWLDACGMLKRKLKHERSQQVKSSNKERRRPQLPSFKRGEEGEMGGEMKNLFFASNVRKMRSDKLPQAF